MCSVGFRKRINPIGSAFDEKMKISPPHFDTWPKSLDLTAWIDFWYPWICETLEIPRKTDEKAVLRILEIVEPRNFLEKKIRDQWKGEEVDVFGPVKATGTLDDYREARVIAVEGITREFLKEGIIPKVVVTDLDSNHKMLAEAEEKGSLLLIHVHGDNSHQVESFFHTYEPKNIILTTQTKPIRWIRNYLGFTDGDRAAFFAKAMGVRRVHIHGFALDGPIAIRDKIIHNYETWKRRKIVKLQIAKTLLCWLGSFVEIIDHEFQTSWPSTCGIKRSG